MSIKLFDKKYLACSNLFITTHENEDYVLPYPLHIHATIESEAKNTQNRIEFKFSSFYDSILIFTGYIDLFLYLLDFEYKVTTLYIGQLNMEESSQDMYGYKATYSFFNSDLILNLTERDYYDDYSKIKRESQPQ